MPAEQRFLQEDEECLGVTGPDDEVHVVLTRAPPFHPASVVSIAGTNNPLIQLWKTGRSYHCYHCNEVIISGGLDDSVVPTIIMECANCSALNCTEGIHFTRDSIDAPKTTVRIFTYSAPFQIPLTLGEQTVLAGFIALWGQLDEIVLVCIAKLTSVNLSTAANLLDGQTSSPRLAMFMRNAKEHGSVKVQAIAKRWHKRMPFLVDKRNHLAHGIWGYVDRIAGEAHARAR